MNIRLFFYFAILSSLSLTACSPKIVKTDAGYNKVVVESGHYEFALPDQWHIEKKSNLYILTRDGFSIQAITLQQQRISNKALDEFYENKALKNEALAILELSERSIAQAKKNIGEQYSVISNQPVTIDNHAGFRIEYSMMAKDQVRMHGITYGVLHPNQRLYSIEFIAPEVFFFNRDQPAFDFLMKYFRFTQQDGTELTTY